MKRALLIGLIFWCGTAQAADLTINYDHYTRPQKGNNYDDGKGIAIGLRHGIYGDLKGRLDAVHVTDIDFPTPVDTKGSFGELRGYGAIYNLIFDLPYNNNVTFNLSAGAGPIWWDFRENPYMQDSHLTVDAKPSFVMKASAGVDIKIYDNWKVELAGGWMDTNISKKVRNPVGDEMNLLDADGNIGLQFITWKIGIRKEF